MRGRECLAGRLSFFLYLSYGVGMDMCLYVVRLLARVICGFGFLSSSLLVLYCQFEIDLGILLVLWN
ncbi:hypothetical protein F5144DRAFT_584227 [Chaetomium tenue]|uniref:Uncharacterized protein n=1 Tax=Chaetomium tenue TaxID=1854479 RepID=A0ACB7P1G9_9PEZI|nr:hypothetical protein F5144DRAFT_584227 [Chaetomium globosum]